MAAARADRPIARCKERVQVGCVGSAIAGNSQVVGRAICQYARNIRSNRDPVFEKPRPLRFFGKPIYITRHGPHPWAGDLDGDEKPDLLCYTEWSVYPFYTHAALEMKARPRFTLGPLTLTCLYYRKRQMLSLQTAR